MGFTTISRRFYWLLLAPLITFARAGGGGGHGSSSGAHGSYRYGAASTSAADPLEVVLFLILAAGIVALVVIYNRWRRAKLKAQAAAAKLLLAQLGQQDRLWHFPSMTARVRQVFFKVQQAWTKNNQALAADCLSASLYAKHQAQTNEFVAKGRRNVLQCITLGEIAIYSVADYQDNAYDTFSAQLTGSMIDYMVDERRGCVLSGSPEVPASFTEIWTFIRVKNKWVLHQILPEANGNDIDRGKLYSETSPAQPAAAAPSSRLG